MRQPRISPLVSSSEYMSLYVILLSYFFLLGQNYVDAAHKCYLHSWPLIFCQRQFQAVYVMRRHGPPVYLLSSGYCVLYSCTPSCLRAPCLEILRQCFCLFYRQYHSYQKYIHQRLIGAGVKMTGWVHGARISFFHEYFL
jgi:hypothetical protein